MKKLFSILFSTFLFFTACTTDAPSEADTDTNTTTSTSTATETSPSGTQKSTDFIALANIYLRNKNKGPEVVDQLKAELDLIKNPSLESIKNFIIEAPKRNTAFLTGAFLKKPTNEDLDNFYIMRTITWSVFGAGPLGPEFVDTLEVSGISHDEKLSAYYRLLFNNLLINPMNPEDYSKLNIDLNQMGLENDQEKAILFYCLVPTFSQRYLQHYNRSREECNKAIAFSNTFPKVNGELFYEVTPPPLKDFLMEIGNGSPNKSFKAHFSDSYLQAADIYKNCKN